MLASVKSNVTKPVSGMNKQETLLPTDSSFVLLNEKKMLS